MIGAGKLDRRVMLLSTTETNTPLGVSKAGRELGKVWAGRTDVSDSEKAAAGVVQGIVRARFLLRSSSLTRQLQPKDRISDGGLAFEIVGIKELGRKDFLEITAEARLDR